MPDVDIVCAAPDHATREGEPGWQPKLGIAHDRDYGWDTRAMGLYCDACAAVYFPPPPDEDQAEPT